MLGFEAAILGFSANRQTTKLLFEITTLTLFSDIILFRGLPYNISVVPK